MSALYTFALLLYRAGIGIASLFNPKAKAWIAGRKDLCGKLRKMVGPEDKTFWIHCASLGEYEQAIPLIKALKKHFATHKILVSFFSPSGYQNFRNNGLVDHVCYMPLDTPSNARTFLGTVRPVAVFFVKYEIWHNFIRETGREKIPLFLVAAHFRPDQVYFKKWGGWFRKSLQIFTMIFVQKDANIALLASIGVNHTEISGDTRLDRVLENLRDKKQITVAEQFLDGEKAIILGSAWEPELDLLLNYLKTSNYKGKIIIAPHETDAAHIKDILDKFKDFSPVAFSAFNGETNSQILVIDGIGMLKYLYQYGRIAVIGGAFGKGLHNILEAVTFGLPVIFGPNHGNFPEADELIRLKTAFAVNTQETFDKQLDLLLGNPMLLTIVGNMNRKYVTDHAGATEKIMKEVKIALMA